MMTVEKIKEKMWAIREAENCIHSVLTVNPIAVDQSVFALLAELKMDLLDAQNEQRIIARNGP